MFKKVLLVGIASLGLTGCVEVEDPAWKNNATQEELALISSILEPNSCTVSRKLIKNAISNRKNKPSEDTSPFKDIENIVKVEESSWNCHNTVTMQEFYRQIHNKELFPVANIKTRVENVKDEPTYTSSSDPNVVIVNNNKILSPKIIDEITEATTQCFSAKVKMVDIVEDKGYLTTEDYPEIMKLISKCKMNTLKNEIEKVN